MSLVNILKYKKKNTYMRVYSFIHIHNKVETKDIVIMFPNYDIFITNYTITFFELQALIQINNY